MIPVESSRALYFASEPIVFGWRENLISIWRMTWWTWWVTPAPSTPHPLLWPVQPPAAGWRPTKCSRWPPPLPSSQCSQAACPPPTPGTPPYLSQPHWTHPQICLARPLFPVGIILTPLIFTPWESLPLPPHPCPSVPPRKISTSPSSAVVPAVLSCHLTE